MPFSPELILLLKATGALWCTEKALEYISKIADDKVVERLKKELFPDVKQMQTRLFGMHQNDFAPLHGFNRWPSLSNPDDFFGKGIEGFEIPPYNYEGIYKVAATHLDFNKVQSLKDEDLLIDKKSNLLLMGGATINSKVNHILNTFDQLPIQFVDRSSLKRKYLPAEHPEIITRAYTDPQNNTYSKESITSKYLVNTQEPDNPPLGPFVSPQGKITGDVILLTILPGNGGKRLIWVTAGYGAGTKLPEIICNGNVLEQLCSSIKHQTSPWLQAAFVVSVDHLSNHEIYGHPEHICTISLGSL